MVLFYVHLVVLRGTSIKLPKLRDVMLVTMMLVAIRHCAYQENVVHAGSDVLKETGRNSRRAE